MHLSSHVTENNYFKGVTHLRSRILIFLFFLYITYIEMKYFEKLTKVNTIFRCEHVVLCFYLQMLF